MDGWMGGNEGRMGRMGGVIYTCSAVVGSERKGSKRGEKKNLN